MNWMRKLGRALSGEAEDREDLSLQLRQAADSAGRAFVKSKDELLEWAGDRATAGRTVPKGFPRRGTFSG